MNTRRFNERVARKRSEYNRARTQRCLRAPAHGLVGSSATQQAQRGSTRLFSLAQSIKLNRKGELAETRVLAESQADVVLERTFSTVEVLSEVQVPISEYPDIPPASNAFDLHDWQDDDDSGDSGEELDGGDVFGHMMKDGRRIQYKEYRKRRDKTSKTQRHWIEQLEPGISAYMDYYLEMTTGAKASREQRGTLELEVIDIFKTERMVIPVVDDYQSTSIIRTGFIPVSPLIHNTAFTTRTVMLYHSLFVQCPKLGKQPFIKSLCDIEGVPFKPYMSSQLSAAFDIYVALKNGARDCAQAELGRDGQDYRLLNTCPPCQLRLKEDAILPIRMVVGMDGNDSLRRVERRGDVAESVVFSADAGNGGEGQDGSALGPSKELPDPRVGGGDYFLEAREVDMWDEENWETVAELLDGNDASPMHKLWNEGECEQRWHNAKESNTARAAGHFMECGWFVLLCRHMLLLLACDMIRSGEQFKYPLATLHRFMSAEKADREAHGEGAPQGHLAVSYDINCKFSKTAARSPLRALAEFMCFLPVIGTMHGYAHQRLCQLLFLMLYIVGAGIEDGEFCERYFSIMNALAATTRHQSIFHRRQSISEVAYNHDNFETYAQLSRFIYNNYKQALGVLATKPTLAREMRAQGLDSAEVFYQWLEEEGEYLRSLCKTPPVETLEMEYFAKLKDLRACQKRLKVVRKAWVEFKPDAVDTTPSVETKHRHEQENERKILADLHAFEVKMGNERWVKGDDNWVRVKRLVRDAAYRKALDKLEGLLVARIFEMARLNVSGTGYKMRKHLAKAFKTRSKTIQNAIAVYNDAAKALSPPRPAVSWEELMEFSFLGEFDLLRDARDDVRERKWASQKNRLLMQQFFKMIRAEEELERLHQEIRRLVTFMAEEQEVMLSRATEVEAEDPALACQIRELWLERGRFNDLHRRRLAGIKKLRGFSRRNNKFFCRGTPVRMKAPVSGAGRTSSPRSEDIEMSEAEVGLGEGSLTDEVQWDGGSDITDAELQSLEDDSVVEVEEDGIDEEDDAELAEKVQTVLSITGDMYDS